VPARQGDIACCPGALGADGFLGHLNHNLLTLSQQIFDARPARRPRRLVVFVVVLGSTSASSLTRGNQPAKVVGRPAHVRDVQVGRLLQADVDESGLHPRQDPIHPAFVDIPRDAPFLFALDVEFSQQAVLHQCNASLGSVRVDDKKAVSHLGTVKTGI